MLPRFALVVGLLTALFAADPSYLSAESAASAASGHLLTIDGLGKGTAPLDGPWQFHFGDDPAWALAPTPDATGTGGWEQLTADKPWGAQGHKSVAGYAWYRKHLKLTTAPGASPDLYLLIRRIEDSYEVFWNGRMVGHTGTMPPHPSYPFSPHLTDCASGSGARRCARAAGVEGALLESSDSGVQGGLVCRNPGGGLTWMASRH